MKKILITGATGFIGRHCLPILIKRDYQIYAVTSKKPQKKMDSISWIRANLLDSDQMSTMMDRIRPSHLLHFAWYVVPEDYSTSIENLIWVEKSLELLRWFRKCGGKRAVMAGTCFEYDWNYGFCDEYKTVREPETFYGICKNALYNMLTGYSEKTGLSSAWGRIFFLYGPNEYPLRLVPSIIRLLLNNKPASCQNGNLIRDYLHVKDIARAFVSLLESDVTGGVNIASGRPVALSDIGYTIAKIIDKSELFRAENVSPSFSHPFYPLLVANTSRLNHELGWKPKYSLYQGLAETVEWWKKAMENEELERS